MRLTNVLDTDQVVNEMKTIVSKNPTFRYPMYHLCECNGISEEEECDYHLEEACRYFKLRQRSGVRHRSLACQPQPKHAREVRR